MKTEHPPGAKDFSFSSLYLGGEKRLIRSSCKLAQFCCVSLVLWINNEWKENFDEKSFRHHQMRQSKVEQRSRSAHPGCYLTKSFHTAILKLSERRFYFIFLFLLKRCMGVESVLWSWASNLPLWRKRWGFTFLNLSVSFSSMLRANKRESCEKSWIVIQLFTLHGFNVWIKASNLYFSLDCSMLLNECDKLAHCYNYW